MAVPLLADERALGVLEVLDRPSSRPFSLAEMDLLGLFANQAAIALDLLQRARRARAALDGERRARRARADRDAARGDGGGDARLPASSCSRALERVLR